jgi:Xaa-Pro aminopeptidase
MCIITWPRDFKLVNGGAMNETSRKLSLLRDLMAGHGLGAILLQRVSSIAWATSGASVYVNLARSQAEVSLLVTGNQQHLLTNNIEATRLEKEEKLTDQGWEFFITPWFEQEKAIQKVAQGLKLGVDYYYPDALDISLEMAHLRANLDEEEGFRFSVLGKLCARAMDAAARSIHPGQTEYEIAAILAGEAERLGVQAIVNLIAVDERIYNYRHPLPTDKKLNRYAMLVLCGRRWGLVCSLTRLVYFGSLPDELRRLVQSVARVDAAMIATTRPGKSLGQVFASAQEAYAEAGFPDEWRLHHQGGPAGYEPREYIATPGSTDLVNAGQVYAWNPSITGCKSEDSVLIKDTGFEVLTKIPGWPTIQVDLGDQTIERPDILVMD